MKDVKLNKKFMKDQFENEILDVINDKIIEALFSSAPQAEVQNKSDDDFEGSDMGEDSDASEQEIFTYRPWIIDYIVKNAPSVSKGFQNGSQSDDL